MRELSNMMTPEYCLGVLELGKATAAEQMAAGKHFSDLIAQNDQLVAAAKLAKPELAELRYQWEQQKRPLDWIVAAQHAIDAAIEGAATSASIGDRDE